MKADVKGTAAPDKPQRLHYPRPERRTLAAIFKPYATLPIFTTWRYVWREVRWTKVPTHPHGTDGIPIAAALAAFDASPALDGIGVKFGLIDGAGILWGIDIDSGTVLPPGFELPQTYAETSPSGNGRHALALWASPDAFEFEGSNRKPHPEIYGAGRFFTLTGKRIGNGKRIETADPRPYVIATGKEFVPFGTKTYKSRAPGTAFTPVAESDLTANERDLYHRAGAAVTVTDNEDESALDYAVIAQCVERGATDEEAARVLLCLRWRDKLGRADYIPRTIAAAREQTGRAAPDDPPPDPDKDAGPDPDKDKWPEPVDPFATVSAPAFAREYAPGIVADFAIATGRSMGVDPGGLALTALAVIGAAVGDTVALQVKHSDPRWTENARLWIGVVGDPSAKKTPLITIAAHPAWEHNRRLMVENHAEEAGYRLALAQAKQGKAAPPQKPGWKRFITDDTTFEALSDILAINVEGVLQVRDELSDWFRAQQRYSQTSAAAPWLQIYNGGPRSFDRVQRGHIYVPNWSAAIVGGIQPETLRALVKHLPHDGLVQRFVPLMVRATPGSDTPVNPALVEGYEKLVARLLARRRYLRHAGESEPPRTITRLAPGAEAARIALFKTLDELVQDAERDDKRLAAHLAKWHGLAARLALAMHFAAGCDEQQEVSEATMAMTARLTLRYLLPHLRAFYADVMGESVNDVCLRDDCLKVCEHIIAKGWQRLASRVVNQHVKRWRYRKTMERAAVFAELEDMGWIRRAERAWAVNPKVHVRFASLRAALQMAASRQREGGSSGPSSAGGNV